MIVENEAEQMRGTLIWFNPEKRHGFIRTEDGERLLVEQSGFKPGHLLGDRCAGTPLLFEREAADVEGGFKAVRVTVVEYNVPRRARLRRR
jgi:cold shock CspA family protein